MPNKPARIIIVDDHPVVREGYQRLLESHGNAIVVDCAASVHEAYQSYIKHRPDLIIMDISLPDGSGLMAARRIRARERDARILMFSIHENPVLAQRAVEAGASGYISKRSAPKMLLEAVCAIARGEQFFDESITARQKQSTETFARLTPREFDIFILLAEGLTVAEIADKLNISPKTVGVHHTRILQKLALGNVAQLTRLAIRDGLIEA